MYKPVYLYTFSKKMTSLRQSKNIIVL